MSLYVVSTSATVLAFEKIYATIPQKSLKEILLLDLPSNLLQAHKLMMVCSSMMCFALDCFTDSFGFG